MSFSLWTCLAVALCVSNRKGPVQEHPQGRRLEHSCDFVSSEPGTVAWSCIASLSARAMIVSVVLVVACRVWLPQLTECLLLLLLHLPGWCTSTPAARWYATSVQRGETESFCHWSSVCVCVCVCVCVGVPDQSDDCAHGWYRNFFLLSQWCPYLLLVCF